MAGESRAVTTAREFREQLIRQEDAALREMSRQWVRMENRLVDEYRLLVQEVLDMQARGEAVPRQMIYNLQRYQQMMAEIAKELPEYDAKAVQIITDHQIESYTLGLEAAEAVIMDTRPSSPMWNRVGKDAAQITAGFAGNGAPLGQLLQRDYGDLGVKITDALVEGVALGKGAFATAKDMRDIMGKEAYTRSVRIARTEINRAYRIANADQYAKSGVVTKVLRLCAKQANTCLACLMMDGDEVPGGVLDDHPNGRCATIAVTVGGIYPQWEHGDKWFEQQDEETQRAIMGPGRYELWKKDGIDPHQMVMMKPNDVWGGSPTVISERELWERYNLTGGNRMLFSVKPAPAPEPPKPLIPEFIPAKTRKDAEEYAAQNFAKHVNYNRITMSDCNEINKTLNELQAKYPTDKLTWLGDSAGKAIMSANFCQLNINRAGIKSLPKKRSDYLRIQERTSKLISDIKTKYGNDIPENELIRLKSLQNSLNRRWCVSYSYDNILARTVTHEYGHILADQYFGQICGRVANKNYSTNPALAETVKKWEDIYKKAKNDGYYISTYGMTNAREFWAECFTAKDAGETLPDYISNFMDEVLKNGIMR